MRKKIKVGILTGLALFSFGIMIPRCGQPSQNINVGYPSSGGGSW